MFNFFSKIKSSKNITVTDNPEKHIDDNKKVAPDYSSSELSCATIIEETLEHIFQDDIVLNSTLVEMQRSHKSLEDTINGFSKIVGESKSLSGECIAAFDGMRSVFKNNTNSIEIFTSEIEELYNFINDLTKKMKVMSDNFEELQQKYSRIQEASNDIISITSKVNMLSLNARIEASKAGEHGKGFEVVANEITALSQDTHSKTNNINNALESASLIFDTVEKSIAESKETVNTIKTASDNFSKNLKEIQENQILSQNNIDVLDNNINESNNHINKLSDYFSELKNENNAFLEKTSHILVKNETKSKKYSTLCTSLNQLLYLLKKECL